MEFVSNATQYACLHALGISEASDRATVQRLLSMLRQNYTVVSWLSVIEENRCDTVSVLSLRNNEVHIQQHRQDVTTV